MAAAGRARPEELESVPVLEVWRRRHDLLDVMALPVGHLAVVFGGFIGAILDPDDREVFRHQYK